MSNTEPTDQMENVVFLQSEVKDPYAQYEKMLREHPVYFDPVNKLWAIHRFHDCQSVLNTATAYVPKSSLAFSNESEEVKYIISHLVRLSNPPHHTSARKATTDLMMHWSKPDTSNLLHYLIGEPRKPVCMDWVNDICRKLPAFALLKGFNFPCNEIEAILPEIESLVKMTLPSRTELQNKEVNQSVAAVLNSIHSFVLRTFKVKEEEETLHLYSANLIGLLIQGYDAGRGLLSNALLQLAKNHPSKKDIDYIERIVKETLRFDPPVHHTRRVLTESILLQDQLLPAGENLLVVLAAANRDPEQFNDPSAFHPLRTEIPRYLTYGAGIHQCMAEHFSIHLTATALSYLYTRYDHIEIGETEIQYEAKTNVRLPVRINILVT